MRTPPQEFMFESSKMVNERFSLTGNEYHWSRYKVEFCRYSHSIWKINEQNYVYLWRKSEQNFYIQLQFNNGKRVFVYGKLFSLVQNVIILSSIRVEDALIKGMYLFGYGSSGNFTQHRGSSEMLRYRYSLYFLPSVVRVHWSRNTNIFKYPFSTWKMK